MNVFLVDLTHGGVKISSELAKTGNYENVFAYDLYNTLKKEDEHLLKTFNVKIINDLDSFKKELELNSKENLIKEKELKLNSKENLIKEEELKDLIINPIHSSLNIKELLIEISKRIDSNKKSNTKNKIQNQCIDSKNKLNAENKILNQYKIINHHQATQLVLSNWKKETKKQNIKTIEITGVKGKTSTAFLLKEIFLENSNATLLLSSLGSYLFRKNHEKEEKITLQKNISITPANIISTIQLAKKMANPKCSTFPRCESNDPNKKLENRKLIESFIENPYQNLNYDIAVFENSLGVCGLGDLGILTNLVENYPIAKGRSNAREAKKQVFDSPLVTIEYETLNEFYNEEKEKYKDKINTFSLYDSNANVFCESIDYDIDNTEIKIIYHDLKTIDGKSINGKLNMDSFAPGSHHVANLLAATTTALELCIDEKTIQNALSKFKGIEGRTNVREINGFRVIEEINPGINTKAIESSIKMIKDIENYFIIIGGKYGVTCEEIDEEKLTKFLYKYIKENPNSNLILTDELGKSLYDKINLISNENKEKSYEIRFIKDYNEAQNFAIENKKNILFIYRSNYSQVSKR